MTPQSSTIQKEDEDYEDDYRDVEDFENDIILGTSNRQGNQDGQDDEDKENKPRRVPFLPMNGTDNGSHLNLSENNI